MSKVVFIDPQSYNNLSLYDKGVLSAFPKGEVTFIGSELWDCGSMCNVDSYLWFNYSSKVNPLSKAFSYLKSIFKISRLIEKIKPAVVHIQWLRLPSIDLQFLKWLQNRNIRVVFTAHNVLPHDSGERYRKQYAKYYQRVDNVIVHSDKTKQELIESFEINADKISVIPHGIIDIEGNNDDANRRMNQIKSDLNLEGRIVFSSLGVQSYYKGVDNIVKVWSENSIFSENPNCHLIIAGKNNGVDFSSLSKLGNVTVINEKLSNIDFLSYIKLSDVILLPYRRISQSGVLFSAINNSVPVLVSNAGGLEEPLSCGKIGWSIGKPSYENLLRRMTFLINNPREINFVRSNRDAFCSVRDFYSWHRISSMTRELYSSMSK